MNSIREAEAKRDAALDIFAQLEESPPTWDLKLQPKTDPEKAASVVLQRLGVSMDDRASWTTHYEALNAWRTAVESLGVLVVQASGVAMHEMRGCSLALFPVPVIVLNSTDSPLGRVFTLLHELAHLARGESSLCDLAEGVVRSDTSDAVEAYCNAIAAAVLIPKEHLLARQEVRNAGSESQWTGEQLGALRRVFWASKESLLRRLLTLGKTSAYHYRVQRDVFQQEYAEQRAVQTKAIVPFYRRVLLANGRFLTRLAVKAYGAQAITGSELSRVLNAKLDHLPRIREALAGEVVA